jgi:predicted SprT family Zn-dependent metalloprotease
MTFKEKMQIREKHLKYKNIAIEEMEKWGLTALGWHFKYNNRKRALGVCKYRTKSIQISRHLVRLNEHAEIMDTIRHEIAHALAGSRAGHGPEWKRWAVKVGARPVATADVETAKMEFRYEGFCKLCSKKLGGWTRKPKVSNRYHRACGVKGHMYVVDTACGIKYTREGTFKVGEPVKEAAKVSKPVETPIAEPGIVRVWQGRFFRIEQLESKTINVYKHGKKVSAMKVLRAMAIAEGVSFNSGINTRTLGKKLLDHLLSK